MVKKYKLTKKQIKINKLKKIILQKQERKNFKNFYVSNFCLTDNLNIAIFNIDNIKNNLDNDIKKIIELSTPWDFTEMDLQMIINRNIILVPKILNDSVIFEGFGSVNSFFFNLIVKSSNCIFCPVVEWNGHKSNRLITVLPEKLGQPLGVLKTVKIE